MNNLRACGCGAALPPQWARAATMEELNDPHVCGSAAALPPEGAYASLGTALREA